MNNATITRIRQAKETLRDYYQWQSRAQNRTLKEMIDRKHQIIDEVFKANKSTPKSVFSELRGYSEALDKVLIEPQLVFLYDIDGKLYKTHLFRESLLPSWETLPEHVRREKLTSENGGTYWRNTLNPYHTGKD